MKMAIGTAANVQTVQLLAACALATIVYLASSESLREAVSVGTFMSFILAMLMLLPPIKRLTNINAVLQKSIAAAQNLFEFLDAEVEEDSGTHRPQQVRGAIEYKHVNFAYNLDKGPVLKDVSFSAEPGQTIAFVGRSGSGKTSLVNLLPRFYELNSGQILLDGLDIREMALPALRSHISLVSQQVTLFNDSIANNIAYGSLGDASLEDIERAAEAAHALDFIRKLPEGFDTQVGENGVLLSGGQRQRIAIARAILKNAPILILDEATSALDTEAEQHIQAAVDNLMQHSTTLVIAHRLSTIEKADCIVVMDQGRIIEQGNHQQLLDQGGIYASLYNRQFQDGGLE
jgi:subfamily B ATP-binding cassette protein MsbA